MGRRRHQRGDPSTTRRVTREARRLLGSLGWPEVGLADIASALGLPEEALLRAFGSKAGLGMAVFMLSLSERFSGMRRTGTPPRISDEPDGLDWEGEAAADAFPG